MIGAYFSGSGAKIRSGAAGLGEYFDGGPGQRAPTVTAFQDGVFSGGSADVWTTEVGDDPGPLRSYHDGSLGASGCAGCGMGQYEQAAAGLGYPLYVDGKPVDAPMSIYHGPSPMAGPLMAYRDGVLGEYFSGEAPRARAFRSGVLGAFTFGKTSGKTLDLTDPATLKEVKSALGMAMPEVSMDPKSPYDEAFWISPLWEPIAGDLWMAFAKKASEMSKGAITVEEITSSGKVPFPNANGILTMLSMGVGSPGYGTDPSYFPTNFPVLHAFQQSAVTSGGTKGYSVKEPFFTVQEKVSGKGMFAGMNVGVIAGIGLVAAVGAFLVLRKK